MNIDIIIAASICLDQFASKYIYKKFHMILKFGIYHT